MSATLGVAIGLAQAAVAVWLLAKVELGLVPMSAISDQLLADFLATAIIMLALAVVSAVEVDVDHE